MSIVDIVNKVVVNNFHHELYSVVKSPLNAPDQLVNNKNIK